ncbi:ATP-binding protein [Streptomyces sp. NPDC051561]|uniref:ATP-binding protein n=1 Tax=Streptomyces sp. NPDC051561 TaxID=3365658 RepID=UPI00379188AA
MSENVVSLFKTPPTSTNTPEDALPDKPRIPMWARSKKAMKAVRDVARHERTLKTVRLVARHSLYVIGGTRIVAKRAWDGRTASRYERMLRAAEVAGQYEVASEWEERGRQFRAARHQRRMDLLAAPQRIAKATLYGAATVTGVSLLLGFVLAIANEDVADILTPALAVVELVRWVVWIVSVVWGPLITLAPWLAMLALWGVGRNRQAAPQWALPARDRDSQGTPITPSIVVTAMRDLGVAALGKAIKEMGDVGAQMLSPIVIAGCGVEVDVHLPSGVSTEEIQNRRRKLAENLNRHEHEVFITIPPSPRTVRLWIADSGALDEPIGPSPLVTDPDTTANYKSGRAPWGQDLRGDAALVSLYQRMLLITGLSNQGKTASLRALALWLAFDPTVEFRIGDLKGVGDWAMFKGLASVLIQGPTDDHVLAVTEMVESGVREMNRRLLSSEKDFPPLVILIDEAQVAYGSGAIDGKKVPLGGSKATSRYFRAIKAIHDQGRAVNVTTWEGTQDPTNENLPKRSREGNHIRSSLVLGTESQARMAVGDAAIDGGAAPHKLRQGLDKGTVVVAGDGLKLAAGQTSVTVRTHYIDTDAAQEIADRAKARRDGVTTLAVADTETEERDALADILTVLGDNPRVFTQDVLKRLSVLSEDTYGAWTNSDLAQVLTDAGAKPYKSDGRMVVGRKHVARALANRDDDGSASAAS